MPNSISRSLKANGMQTMRFILILFLLAASVSACHPAYPREGYDELRPSTGGPLTARFFGVSTILLSDGNTAIMTDGFFSRPAPASCCSARSLPIRIGSVKL